MNISEAIELFQEGKVGVRETIDGGYEIFDRDGEVIEAFSAGEVFEYHEEKYRDIKRLIIHNGALYKGDTKEERDLIKKYIGENEEIIRSWIMPGMAHLVIIKEE